MRFSSLITSYAFILATGNAANARLITREDAVARGEDLIARGERLIARGEYLVARYNTVKNSHAGENKVWNLKAPQEIGSTPPPPTRKGGEIAGFKALPDLKEPKCETQPTGRGTCQKEEHVKNRDGSTSVVRRGHLCDPTLPCDKPRKCTVGAIVDCKSGK